LEGEFTLPENSPKPFEFHIGGYLPPYQTLQEVHISIPKHKHALTFDMQQFIRSIDLNVLNNVMIPGKNAAELAKKLQQTVKIESIEE
jgi:hypothetical protein